MNFLSLFGEETTNGCNNWGTENIILIVLLGVMLIALIVLPMFTNKKRAKAVNELYNSVKVGSVIKTVGGIIGTVTEIRDVNATEKEIVVETGVGDNKTTMLFDIQAVYQVMQPAPAAAVPAEEAPVEEQPAEEKPAEEVKSEEPAQEAKEETVTEAKEEVPVESEDKPVVEKKTPAAAKKNSSKK